MKAGIYIIKEIKLKIIDVLEELNQSKEKIIGVIAFLKNAEDANNVILVRIK